MVLVTPNELSEYTSFMHALADKADAIAQKYFDQSVGYELKADASPVTIADTEIEMALVCMIRSAYPEHGIFGEESARINPDASVQWVIDPIDGTKAFIAGKPTFVTLLALCENRVPRLGLISQPIKQKRWLSSELTACKEPCNQLADAHIATTSVGYFSAREMMFFQQLEHKTSTTLLNHDGLAIGLMADGSLDLVIEAKLKPYDFAALVPIVESIGGIITDWQGQPLTLDSDGHLLASTNKALHNEVLKLINTPDG